MHIFFPSSLFLVLTKVSYINLLITLETYYYFSFSRGAMYNYPWYSSSIRWNNIIVYI